MMLEGDGASSITFFCIRGGPDAGAVCVRLPGKPMKSVFVRKPPGLKYGKRRPGRRRGLRTPAGKANELGFRTQTPGLKYGRRRPGRRRGLRTPAGKANELGFRTPARRHSI